MQLLPTILSLCHLALFIGDGMAKAPPKNSILLSKVKSLTLRADAKTSHRRVAAVPQLKCIGSACKHHTVDIMRCVNAGADYDDEQIQWSCTATMPEEFKLGGTEVICEGYDSADDDRVLKGSCGVEYKLLLTDKGEERYGGSWWSSSKGKEKAKVQQSNGEWPWGRSSKNTADEGWDLGSSLFVLIFVAVAAWILYSMFVAARTTPAARRRPRQGGFGGWGGGPGGGGGGGGDPWDDPPPPYPGKRTAVGGEQWRPGFWTGTAAGAAAGYLAGNRGTAQQQPAQRNTGGWFGGGDSGAGPSRPSRSSPSSGSSSSRHESTGFGSTSRR